ncbi:MAG TPA: gamma carbonic anhydrase family protein [Solirubrobacterales bacterium]|nr:gamma carbonic anhydrase family protein [Solirubrobacterales bacterium]
MTVSALGDLVPRIDPTAWVHPSATVVGDVEIGPESSVWPGAVLRGDFGAIRVGARTSIQDNAVLHAAPNAPTVVGDECVIAHLAFIETAVVEDLCLVGVGAVVLPGAHLRRGAVAAAGAVLAQALAVPSGHRAIGVPATVVPSEHPSPEYIATGARSYAAMAARFAVEERPLAEGGAPLDSLPPAP